MSRQVIIQELNPQKPPEAIPGLRTSVKFGSSNRTVARYQTMAPTRPIEITSGVVLIVDDNGRPDAAASNLTLPAPPQRSVHEQGADGSTLQIISTCRFKHVVRTPPLTVNGRSSLLKFTEGYGAVELYASAGKWLVLSSSGVEIE